MMRAVVPWWIYAAVAAPLAVVTLGHWIWAITLRGPVLYGEGAVAHAAILARARLEYATAASGGDLTPIFTAANYPPLYFHLAGLGDPFVVGRVLSIVATLFVAGAIASRARAAGVVVAAAMALAWLASVPVMSWGPAVKPDLVAVALTVGAVLAIARERALYIVAGALIGLAVLAKPTALLPGLALFAFVARRDRLAAARALAAGTVAAAVTFLLTHPPDAAMRMHVIDWNALPWRGELLAGLVVVAALVLVVPVATVFVTRSWGGAYGAYFVGAAAVLVLGGREGATINYFLDLSAATGLALAGAVPRLALSRAYPIASIAQAILAVALLNPFPGLPSLLQPTGKWGDPSRITFVREIPGILLVEDSGLLVADGREPFADDLFLWSRLSSSGHIPAAALLDAVRAGRFDAVVSEVDLQRLDAGPGYERQRWHPDLVAAVLERYQMTRPAESVCPTFVPCLYVYTRR